MSGIGSLMPEEEPTEVTGVPDDDPWLFAVDRRRSSAELDSDDRAEPAADALTSAEPGSDDRAEPAADALTSAEPDSFGEQPIDAPLQDQQIDPPIFGELIENPPLGEELIEDPPIDDPFGEMPDGSIGDSGGIDVGLFPSEAPAPPRIAGAGLFDSGAGYDDVAEAGAFPDMDVVYAGLSDEGITPTSPAPEVDPFEGSTPSITIDMGPVGPEAIDPLAVLGLRIGATWSDVTSARRALLDSEPAAGSDRTNRRPEINQAAATLRLLRVGPLQTH